MGQHEVKTICMRDCPDACSIIATVEDGRVIRQRGDPDHGVTRGFLCARGNAYLKRQYDPARLLYPHRRTSRRLGAPLVGSCARPRRRESSRTPGTPGGRSPSWRSTTPACAAGSRKS